MELTPIDRLQAFLEVNHPEINVHRLKLSPEPGFLTYREKRRSQVVMIDIRGAGYPYRENGKYVSRTRLWQELFDYFGSSVYTVKVKNGLATRIMWQGRNYVLDHQNTFTKKKKA